MHEIDISRVDLNLLVVFEALIEERHVGRAAKRLSLSQSATSHALGRLRTLFGDPLFVRNRTGMVPTPRAKELARPLAEALAQVRRVVGPAAPFDPALLVRSFTVATHDYAVVVLLSKVLLLLRREAPGVDLRCIGLSYEDLADGFDRGVVDLACGALPGFEMQRLERTPLFEDRLVGVVRAKHHALQSGRMSLAAFVSIPHVSMSVAGERHGPVDDALRVLGRRRRVAMVVPSALSLPSIVASSDLVGVIPSRLATALATRHGLVTFELPVKTKPVTCDLLLPRALAALEEARWLKSLFQRAAALQTSSSTERRGRASAPSRATRR